MWVQFLGRKDPLEEEMTTYSQYSCLENAMDGGAWRATVHGAAESNRLNGHEFEQSPGDSEGQGSLTCCSPWRLQRVGHN